MKFDDVKNLPAPLQPLAIECSKMEENYNEVKGIIIRLIDEVTITKALVQELLRQLQNPEGVHNEHAGAAEELGTDGQGTGEQATGSGTDAAGSSSGPERVAAEQQAEAVCPCDPAKAE